MQPIEAHRHDKAADAVHEGRPVEARFVRGGGKGRSLMTILIISTFVTALLLIGLLVFWNVMDGDVDRSAREKAADSAAFSQTVTP